MDGTTDLTKMCATHGRGQLSPCSDSTNRGVIEKETQELSGSKRHAELFIDSCEADFKTVDIHAEGLLSNWKAVV